MTRTFKFLPIFLLIILNSCAPVKQVTVSPVRFSAIQPASIASYHQQFADYCRQDPGQDYEKSAVISNFFGDNKKSVEFATLNEGKLLRSDYELQIPDNQVRVFKDVFEKTLNDPMAKAEDKVKARRMLTLVTSINYNTTFTADKMTHAANTILEQADGYHFLLINEAHHTGQHRAFTSSLLKPLWDKGYRYLALEALSNDDPELMSRGYPIRKSGYYLTDPVFGNMIRQALALGYKLIPYETTSNNSNSTLRDGDQARNIYTKTLKADPDAKVVIHAGYSHIAEDGSSGYSPMGKQLKELARQNILTVDQVMMTEHNDSLKTHPYYRYVANKLKPLKPVMFRKNNDILVDQVNLTSIDMQVYHPVTTYRKGRPQWLLSGDKSLYDLPAEFKQFKGFLLQAFKAGEAESAIPVDQFVIDEEKALVLKPGKFVLKLTDRNGKLTGTASLLITDR